MKYANLIAAIAGQPWAIEPTKGQAILDFLILAAAGGKVPEAEALALAEEAEARMAAAFAHSTLEAKRLNPRTEAKIAKAPGGVAVIPVHGVMAQRVGLLEMSSGGVSTDTVGRQVAAAAADSEIKAIVLHVESPGGSVYGMAELSDRIFKARDAKPVIAQIDSYAASAAYWAASQATEIVVSPGGDVGSIGVLTVHDDISERLAAEGIKRTIVSAGDHKVEGNPYEPLTDEARDTLQTRVDDAHADFIGTVARGRGIEAAEVAENYGKGRMVKASRAVSIGMADRVATFEDTLRRFAAATPGVDTRRARLALAEITGT